MARPSLYTPEVLTTICDRLAAGEFLTVICSPDEMPAPRTVMDWAAADPEIAAAIARAREAGEHAIMESTMALADKPPAKVLNKQGDLQVDPGDVQNRKLQIETRLKALAKFNPKRWGDRQQIEHTGKLSLEALITGDGSTE